MCPNSQVHLVSKEFNYDSMLNEKVLHKHTKIKNPDQSARKVTFIIKPTDVIISLYDPRIWTFAVSSFNTKSLYQNITNIFILPPKNCYKIVVFYFSRERITLFCNIFFRMDLNYLLFDYATINN